MQLFINDTQAAISLREGEMRALEYFYNCYKPQLFNFLLPYCKDQVIAEELVQDAYLKLWDSRKGIDATRNVKNFLFTIAKNLAFDQIKRVKLEQRFAHQVVLNIQQDNGTLDGIILSDYNRCLTKVIAAMPERHRQVFSLSRDRHLSNAEISAELSISVKTVEKHMTGTLKTIRGFLKDYDILVLLLPILGFIS